MRALTVISILTILLFSSCSPANSENKDIAKLKEKREKLKSELNEINAELDSLENQDKKEIYSIVIPTNVIQDTFYHKIEVQGDVETEKNISLNAEASGLIQKLTVSDGDEVKKGQLIAIIDGEMISDNIRELEASLDLANFVYEKQKKLYDEGVTSELQFKEAKNNKVSLEKKLSSLRTQKSKTILRAPFSGKVDQVFVKQGEMTSPQMPILRLVNNDEVKVTAEISEQHLTRVGIGTPLELKFPVLNDTIIKKEVTMKGNFINPTNRTFKVQAHITNNKLLLPNMVSIVQITDIIAPNVKIVKIDAVLQDNDDHNYVYKLTKEKIDGEEQIYKATKVIVSIKSSYNGNVWIEGEGLNSNDMIALDGAKSIADGELVKLKTK